MADFKIVAAGEDDKQELYNFFVKSYFPDVPLIEALNFSKPVSIDEWQSLNTLKDGLSLKVLSQAGELIGFALNTVPKHGAFRKNKLDPVIITYINY